eukprot:jgi/Hompol1/4111/HPOL_006929-RA
MTNSALRDRHISIVGRIPHFADDNELLTKIVDSAAFSNYQANETIINQDSLSLNMYWILSGTCRSVKFMPFLKRKGLKGEDITIMCTKDTQLRKDEKPVDELVTLFEYEEGDTFPSIPKNLVTELEAETYHLKSAFINEMSKPHGIKSEFTVITSSNVEVMSISWKDYATHSNIKMIRSLLSENRYNFTEQDVVAAYEARVAWDAFKKKTTEEVTSLSRKPTRKDQ